MRCLNASTERVSSTVSVVQRGASLAESVPTEQSNRSSLPSGKAERIFPCRLRRSFPLSKPRVFALCSKNMGGTAEFDDSRLRPCFRGGVFFCAQNKKTALYFLRKHSASRQSASIAQRRYIIVIQKEGGFGFFAGNMNGLRLFHTAGHAEVFVKAIITSRVGK